MQSGEQNNNGISSKQQPNGPSDLVIDSGMNAFKT